MFCCRADSEHKDVVKHYDWTYTTDYKGTLLGEDLQIKVIWHIKVIILHHVLFPKFLRKCIYLPGHTKSAYDTQVSATSDRIDLEKLKAREQIMFFEEVLLFEDELHDHGVSMISVKIVSDGHVFICKLCVVYSVSALMQDSGMVFANLHIYKCLDLEKC